jgi:glutamine amidotransferase
MSAREVTVVDYGLGNLMSVSQALTKVGARPLVTGDPERVLSSDRIVLPGVGAFGVAMGHLRELGLDEAVKSAASKGVPVLGICLGMQLLLDYSLEFGRSEGIGLIPGKVLQVVDGGAGDETVRATHIGWRELQHSECGQGHKFFNRAQEDDAFYFVHSYSAHSTDSRHTLATVNYGGHDVTAVVVAENVAGVQFHPEKSGPAGLRILENFLAF